LPMPHRTQLQLIRRRLAGKEGSERARELRAILRELPNYRNGPYADIRKWVRNQVEETRIRSGVTQRDSIAVRRQGAAQVALVGPPNGGKSSLLQALSHVQIKIGDYAFTTLRPVPALTRIGGVLIQLVEIPGLIAGAAGDRAGGRALLGAIATWAHASAPHASGDLPRSSTGSGWVASTCSMTATPLRSSGRARCRVSSLSMLTLRFGLPILLSRRSEFQTTGRSQAAGGTSASPASLAI
jgi:50S ribosome-binding GTPase